MAKARADTSAGVVADLPGFDGTGPVKSSESSLGRRQAATSNTVAASRKGLDLESGR